MARGNYSGLDPVAVDVRVANCDSGAISLEGRRSDARLIAAALQLLDALEAIVGECKGPDKPYSGDSYLPEKFIEPARAAIAAARGQA